jgi:hypothetical protein
MLFLSRLVGELRALLDAGRAVGRGRVKRGMEPLDARRVVKAVRRNSMTMLLGEFVMLASEWDVLPN